MQRSIEQLVARVRDLEGEVQRLRRREVQPRIGMEAAIVSIESADTRANGLGPVVSDAQTIASGTATVMEIVDDAGTLKLKPIQNSSGANRETLTYFNANLDKPIARTAGQSFLVIRLRDGRWYRVGDASGKLFITTTTITARTGSASPYTPGNGSGTMLEFYDDAGTKKVRTTSVTETLRHMGNATIASGRIVHAKLVDGEWVIDVDYCGGP